MRVEPPNMVVLSRRNLLSLLAKLDGNPPGSACTIGREGLYVRAEEDQVHYGERKPGVMHPDTEVEVEARRSTQPQG